MAKMNARFERLDLLVSVESKLLKVYGSDKVYHFLLVHAGENMMRLL